MKFIPPNTWKVTPMKKQNRVTLNHDKVYNALDALFTSLTEAEIAERVGAGSYVYETDKQQIYNQVEETLGIGLTDEEKKDVLELAKDFGSFYWK